MKRISILLLLSVVCLLVRAENKSNFPYGRVVDVTGEPLAGATVKFRGTSNGVVADASGHFQFKYKPDHGHHLEASFMGFESKTLSIGSNNKPLLFTLMPHSMSIDEIEVVAERGRVAEKIDLITRMPLRRSELIQGVSVVSEQVIAQQGNMTLTDASKNVVGVSSFATYGNAGESLSARGFRGVPVLKNGVRVHSDFRGQGSLTDMQGVESVQVLKGAAAVTQGIGNDLGSAAGVVNIATKTPKYTDAGALSMRIGSWGQLRPTFDFQRALNSNGTLGVRLNGALEYSDSYRANVNKDRFYLNPSFAWKANSKTELIFEADYLHDSRTPDRGTVNLAPDSVYALYDMPHDRFLGFKGDRVITDQLSVSARLTHRLSDRYSVRFIAAGSFLNTDNLGSSTKTLKNVATTGAYNLRERSLGRSLRDDRNQVVQLDLIGRDVYTGKIKHSFQVGLDFKRTHVETTAYNTIVVDTIDVFTNFSNKSPKGLALKASDPELSTAYSYGVMVQDVITFNKYLKMVAGARFSLSNSVSDKSAEVVSGNAFNPMLGVILTPLKGVRLFGSYSNTTDLRSASNLMSDGTPMGASTTEQFETGIKSDWLNNRLQVNVTLFSVINRDLAYQLYNEALQPTGRYDKAGDLSRRGGELEVTGRVLPNLQVIAGYAYLQARYRNSPAYVDGSAPMNAPKHTANGWIHYTLEKSRLKGVSFGLGAYYTGQRPVGDYSQKPTHANTSPGMRPFDMKAYTTVNGTVAYAIKNNSVNLTFNNIFNQTGYSSYFRGGYINPIDPFNMAVTYTYQF